MEHEVSSVARLGVTLIIMAALLNIVWFTVKLGLGVANDEYQAGAQLSETIEITQLKSLANTDGVIVPTAAAYNLVASESSAISKLTITREGSTCEVTYGTNKWEKKKGDIVQDTYASIEESLKEDLGGKMLIVVYESAAKDGTYEIVLSEET